MEVLGLHGPAGLLQQMLHSDPCPVTFSSDTGQSQVPVDFTWLTHLEVWRDDHYSPAWLWQVGVSIQLGHRGAPCPHVLLTPEDHIDDVFMESDNRDNLTSGDAPPGRIWLGKKVVAVVHANGVHHMPVALCGCPGGLSEVDGFIELGLLPATMKRVQTVFSIEVSSRCPVQNNKPHLLRQVLDDCLISFLECHTTPYHYYKKLQRNTNSAFPHTVPVGVITHID